MNTTAQLSETEQASLSRVLAEPGIELLPAELTALLAGARNEVHELVAAGRVAEALGVASYHLAERRFGWSAPACRALRERELGR